MAGDERPADLSRAEVYTLLSDGFAPYATSDEHRDRLAGKVLHAIATRNGLLLKQSGEQGEVYTFPHRTFQEFLAGYHLKGQQRDYLQRALSHAGQPHWHEVLTLMVGYQVLSVERELERPLTLVKELLGRAPQQQILVGELLALIGRERTSSYDPALVQPGGLWHRARDVLLRLSTQGHAPEVPAPLRARAGLVLGQLCYGTMAALCRGTPAPLPDPRLPLAVLGPGSARSGRWREALDAYWCPIAPGPFWSGDDRKSNLLRSALKKVHLPHAYRIGRYPIINADFARFVAAGGYGEPRWWGEHGWKWRLTAGNDDKPLDEPVIIDSVEYNNPIQPIVLVRWYEAAAYCAWLTEQGHIQGWLPADDVIRLPTALEWERAARGTDKRRYPWGDTAPNPERANYDDTGIGRPSPIGCFPVGQAVCGALDMVGNVEEWTATAWEQSQEITPVVDPERGTGMIWTGGSFSDGNERLCCGARIRYVPIIGNFYLGFRVAWSPRSLL
jgi:formylglycine-generating enzyme required for sulfatase activity